MITRGISFPLTLTATLLGLMLAPGLASAITLPDDSSCSTASGNPGCLRITNTNNASAAPAIAARNGSSGAGTGPAVYGLSGSGDGVLGTSSSSNGVHGLSSTGNGVSGESSGGSGTAGVLGSASSAGQGMKGVNTANGVGVWGSNTGTGNGGTGIYGSSVGNTNDAGVIGDCPLPGYAGYFYGDVYATGHITQLSDRRMKNDITAMPYGLKDVLRMRPVTFKWNDAKQGTGRQVGLIAQEVQAVLPEVVRTGRDGMLGMDYPGIVPVLLKAIQEQQLTIDQQGGRISDLERRNRTTTSSVVTGGIGAALGLAVLPLGMVAVRRRRRSAR